MKKKRDSGFPVGENWQKILLIMKLKLFLILFTCCHVTAAVHSQNNLLDMQLEDVSLERVIWELEEKTDFTFMYWTSEIKDVKVSLNMKQKSINEILDFCLRNTNLKYEINGDAIVIHRVKDEKPGKRPTVIKGLVKDINGNPLPGVTIMEKGTKSGVATNVKGEFTYSTFKDTVTFVVSFIGMKTKEVVWNGEKTLRVLLDDDCVNMDEVVVTGYQTIDKRKLTSSISSLTDKDLDFRGALTVDQMLEGKVPGLLSMTLSTMPGAATKMRLRGSSTFTGTREPLWVIDGIIYENPVPLSADEINSWDNINLIGNAITGLNPQDIERIDVLKDASATAIYGTRAANGVIVVTTKTGKVGKTSLSYNFNAGFMRRPTYDDFELMSSKERVDVSREIMDKGLYFDYTPQRMGYEGLMMDYWDKKISFAEFQQGVSEMEGRNTDWFKALFRNSFSQSHDISLSGGNENTRYYFSFGYSNNKGTERGTDLSRLTARMNLSTRTYA